MIKADFLPCHQIYYVKYYYRSPTSNSNSEHVPAVVDRLRPRATPVDIWSTWSIDDDTQAAPTPSCAALMPLYPCHFRDTVHHKPHHRIRHLDLDDRPATDPGAHASIVLSLSWMNNTNTSCSMFDTRVSDGRNRHGLLANTYESSNGRRGGR